MSVACSGALGGKRRLGEAVCGNGGRRWRIVVVEGGGVQGRRTVGDSVYGEKVAVMRWWRTTVACPSGCHEADLW